MNKNKIAFLCLIMIAGANAMDQNEQSALTSGKPTAPAPITIMTTNIDLIESDGNQDIPASISSEHCPVRVLAYPTATDSYEGTVNDKGLPNGMGVVQYGNGYRYEGCWKDGKRTGKGVMLYPNGDRYEGDWDNDKKQGTGAFIWENGDKYEGNVKNGAADGKGTFASSEGTIYVGDWHDGDREGKGTVTFINGRKYEGSWKSNQPTGRIRITHPNGYVYTGIYEMLLIHKDEQSTYSKDNLASLSS